MLPVLAQFSLTVPTAAIEDLGNAGGFSGSHLWRITVTDAIYCLRRWPAMYPSRRQLTWIHQCQEIASRGGVHEVPQFVRGRLGDTLVEYDGTCWELATWMPGAAEKLWLAPTSRIEEALRLLARFHRTLAHAPYGSSPAPYGSAPQVLSPGICKRSVRLSQLADSDLPATVAAIKLRDIGNLGDIAHTIGRHVPHVAHAIANRLAPWTRMSLPQQACLRDIHRDHVLFVEDRTTGLIDFGAMQVDITAIDIARLLGSLARDDADRWRAGLAAYAEIVPLDPTIQILIGELDVAAVVLSAVQWLEWIGREGRSFENWDLVRDRMNECATRLVELVGRQGEPVLPKLKIW